MLTDVAGTLFFFTGSRRTGEQLWKSNGTAAGTVLVKTIHTGTTNVGVVRTRTMRRAVGRKLFFVVGLHQTGQELWVSDGTAAGTSMVKDINPGKVNGIALSGRPLHITDLNGVAYFSANAPTVGRELWRSDGTAAGTSLVKDTVPGPNGGLLGSESAANRMAVYKGRVYFSVGKELWASNGSASGTFLVKRWTGVFGRISQSHWIVASRSWLFFVASDGTNASELWRSNGTSAGTTLVKDIRPGNSSSNPFQLQVINSDRFFDKLFFIANDGTKGFEPWVSDGTTQGTQLVFDFEPGAIGSMSLVSTKIEVPMAFASTTRYVFFAARDRWRGSEMRRTSFFQPQRSVSFLREAWPGTPSGVGITRYGEVTAVDGRTVVYAASNGRNGLELWVSQGSISSTKLLKNIRSDTATLGSSPGHFTDLYGATAFLVADSGSLRRGAELYRSDGTPAGTSLLRRTGVGAHQFEGLVEMNGTWYFIDRLGAFSHGLFKTDGTATGTRQVVTMSFQPKQLVSTGSQLFFVGFDFQHGEELWRSDGTQAGTRLVKDIWPGSGRSDLRNLVAIGRSVWFTATTVREKAELWKSDGTRAGTVLVKDIEPGSGGSDPGDFVEVAGRLYFRARTQASGTELYSTLGSPATTALVADIQPGPGSSLPSPLGELAGSLFFYADDGRNGREPWLSKGTAATTAMLKDIASGAASSSGGTIAGQVHSTHVRWFVANDAVHGAELCKSDGTSAGTVRVTDLNPGTFDGVVGFPVYSRGQLFFPGDNGQLGAEPYVLFPGASAIPFGHGCATEARIPRMRSGDPVLGGTLTISGSLAPAGHAGFVVAGVGDPRPVGISTGCTFYVPGTLLPIVVSPSSSGTWNLRIPLPSAPTLTGQRLVIQSVYLGLAPLAHIDLSNPLRLTLGK